MPASTVLRSSATCWNAPVTTMLSRTLTLATVATLLLGPACGGSDTPTAGEDKALAGRIVLTSADLPGGTV